MFCTELWKENKELALEFELLTNNIFEMLLNFTMAWKISFLGNFEGNMAKCMKSCCFSHYVLEKVWSWKGGGAATDAPEGRSLLRASVRLVLTAPPEAGHSSFPVNICSYLTEAEMSV